MEKPKEAPEEKDDSDKHIESKFEEKIDLIENQIHSINIKLNTPKKEKWWKKNSSLIISIVALITSIGFTVHNLIKENTAEKEKSVSERIKKIENLTIKLTELSEKNLKLASENPNTDLNNLASLINYQRSIYINEIIESMNDFNEDFPPGIYDIVGNELRNEGHYNDALKYYKQGFSRSKTSNEKVIAYRNLGNIYGIQNTPIYKPDSSHYYWKKSISESNKILGEQKFTYKGYSYHLWAGNEFYKGNNEFAKKLIDSAIIEYSKLPENNQNKHFYIGQLIQMIEFDKRKDLNKISFNLTGDWKTLKSSSTRAEISFYKNVNGWFCNLEIFKKGRLEYNLTGALLSVTDDYMKFNLQGMKKLEFPSPYNDRTSVLASLKLSINSEDSDKLDVIFNEINGIRKKFKIEKK